MRNLIIIFCFWVSTSRGQQTIRTILKLPDTGQSKSYTNTPGEDADFSIYSPYLIQNQNGTVTDTVTGLMWTQADGGEMTYENAQAWAKALRTGGYQDWRLPTPLESFTILHLDLSNPALDQTKFSATGTEYWWTNYTQAGDTGKVWVTNAGGGIGNHPKKETKSAGGNKIFAPRAVRSLHPDTYISDRFRTLSGSIYFDSLTDLTWLILSAADSLNWEAALQFSDSSTRGGYHDWRLPNIKELMSLTDYSLTGPALSRKAFPQIGNIKIWSSTSLPNQPMRAWYLDTRFGITSYADKTIKLPVWLVRNDITGSTGIKTTQVQQNRPFPNPFGAELFYTGNNIYIFNSQGSLVFQGDINQTLYTGDWPAGLYILWDQHSGYTAKLMHVTP